MTTIVTDHFTLQGHSLQHLEKGCQDYACSFTEGDTSVAIVCDGCSSAPNSDFGARVLALLAGTAVKDWLPMKLADNPLIPPSSLAYSLQCYLIDELNLVFEKFNNGSFLGPLLFDCTLLIVVRHKNQAYAFMFGDGYIAVQFTDGRAKLIRREYTCEINGMPCSAPLYLSYGMETSKARFTKYLTGQPTVQTTVHAYQDGNWHEEANDSTPVVDLLPFYLDFDFNQTQSLVVSTDGIDSFDTSKTDIKKDIVRELLFPAKQLRGTILTRKVLYNSTRVWPKNNWKHQDDLGIAGILRQ